MRSALLPFVFLIVAAGCTRNATAPSDANPEPQRPVAVVEKQPKSLGDAPLSDAPLGENVDGSAVSAASLDATGTALKDTDPAARRAAIKQLGQVRWKLPDPVGRILSTALADSDAEVRLDAIRLAAADPFRAEDIARLLTDGDRRVRLAAARALVVQGKHEAEAYPVLSAVLTDPRSGDRRDVLALIRVKAPASQPAAPALIAMSLDAQDPLRIEAIAVMGQLGAASEVLDALLMTAHEAEPKARAAALRALGQLAPTSPKVQVAAHKALRDPQVEVAIAAADVTDHEGVAVLIDYLKHGDDRLRGAAARALGRLGPDAWEAVAELNRLAQSDPTEGVRQSARTALKTILPPAL
jgi:HEAT repeat protein